MILALRVVVVSALLSAAAAAQAPDSSAVVPYDTAAGDLAVGASGAPFASSAEARYWITDGLSVGVAWDRQPFRLDAYSTLFGDRDTMTGATTISLSAETGGGLGSGRLFYMSGVQVFARRQTDDVLIGYEEPGGPALAVDDGGRRIDALGVGLLSRVEVRAVGPLHLGVASSLVGVSLERTRGAVLDGGVLVSLGGEQRTRLRFANSTRLYLGVRL